jgi:type I restriction enzyme S subunit
VRTNGSSDLIGRGAVVRAVPEDYYFASYLIRYRLLMFELLGEWMSAVWDSFAVRSKIKLLAASSAGQYNVSLSKLDQVLFPLPPADEIEVLNSMLRTAMGKISPIAKCLSGAESDLDRLDQSVLAKAFRGELVPQDPNDESASVLLERIKDEREAAKGQKKTSRNKK